MANVFYRQDATRASRVRDLFGAIAGRYDLMNDLQSLGMHRLWKRRVISLAEAKPGMRALDLCCGTGDVTGLLSEAGCEAVGLDFSLPMLQVGARRGEGGGGGGGGGGEGTSRRCRFAQGDGLHLPFLDASFDIVTISYGLRNLADIAGGLAEMWRVLRPGGRLVILDFGHPPNGFVRSLYFAYLRMAVPVMGRVFAGSADAYGYILESLKHYPAQAGVSRMLEAMGACDVAVWNLLLGTMSIHRARKSDADGGRVVTAFGC